MYVCIYGGACICMYVCITSLNIIITVVSDPARKKSQGVLWGLFNGSCESKKKIHTKKYKYKAQVQEK